MPWVLYGISLKNEMLPYSHVSLAGQRTNKRLVTYLLLRSWLSTIWKNWSTSRKNLSEQTQLRLGVEAGI